MQVLTTLDGSMPEHDDEVIYARFPPELKRRLEAAAEKSDLRVAQLLRRIVTEWLDRYEKRQERQ